MPKGMGYGKSMQRASSSAGAAGTHVDKDGKTSIRKTLDPPFGKRKSKRGTSKRGARTMSSR